MTEEPFLLVSLEEAKAKSLAQVLSNDTARKILDFLSKREHATETEISKEMTIPLSTVHYNLDLLVKSELVSDQKFTYSEKGKEIVHYMLSNKYVIIAPKKSDAILSKLKGLLPAALVSGAAALGIKYLPELFRPKPEVFAASKMVADSGSALAAEAAPFAQQAVQTQEVALWFIAGSLVALVAHLVFSFFQNKK
ncbi:MAG: helix-turn-helix transcriptional regulator [Nanoarchaeota archaeon]|nr:helix-turn-helix transcriptional regulator [Nanoarchaeota archaeon]